MAPQAPAPTPAPAFHRAVKYEQKLRLALCGPTGSGKTYTALLLAQELAQDGRVALIDTEHQSASLYADLFDFDTLQLTTFAPKAYITAIRQAAEAGYAALIIDSLSHAWMGKDGALDQVDRAGARMGGNKFAAWRDVTPQHNNLVDAMLSAPMHVIATMRSKMEYILEPVVKEGREVLVPKKVGMAPVQRDGVEYEFTLVGEMDINHTLVITKSRIGGLADQVIHKPDAEVAKAIMQWLHGAPEPAPEPAPSVPPAGTPPVPSTNGIVAMPQAAFWAEQGKRGLKGDKQKLAYRYLGIPDDTEHPLTEHWLKPAQEWGLTRDEAYGIAHRLIGEVLAEATLQKNSGEAKPVAAALAVVQPRARLRAEAERKGVREASAASASSAANGQAPLPVEDLEPSRPKGT